MTDREHTEGAVEAIASRGDLYDQEGPEVIADAISRVPLAMVIADPRIEDTPIVYTNDAFEQITLYSREFAIGRNCRFLQGEDTDEETVASIRKALSEETDVSVDILNYKADGTPFKNRLMIAPIRNDEEKVVAFLGVQREIGAKGKAAVSSRSAIERPDEDVMLAEIQHRVKNHLAMVVSLIRMQASKEITRESFNALSHRVESLALLYDELSGNGIAQLRTERVPVGAYLSRITAAVTALDGRGSIRVNVHCEPMEFDVEAAAKCGLLLTELLTNALEHAFEGRDDGQVVVSFRSLSNGGARLIVEDDGVGLPEGSPWLDPDLAKKPARLEAEESLGRQIVASLVQSIGATMNVSSTGQGTIVTINIPDSSA